MVNALPIAAFVLAGVAFWGFDARGASREGRQPVARGASLMLAILAGLGFLGISLWRGAPIGIETPLALTLGLICAFAAYLAEGRSAGAGWGRALTPLALAVAVSAAVPLLFPDSLGSAQLAAVFGAAAGAWGLAAGSKGRSVEDAFRAAVFLAVLVAADRLGRQHVAFEPAASTGVAFGLVAVVAGMVGALVSGRSTSRGGVGTLVALAVLAAGSFLVGQRYLDLRDTWVLFLISGAGALLVHWLLPEEEPADALRVLLATLIWIGLATAAFALRRGYGMSISMVSASSVLLLLGNRRALLSAGPLLALVYYRVFREDHVAASRALDIGQHYAMVGMAVGLLLPLLPLEWLRGQREERCARRAAVGATLWTLALGIAPIGVAALMGPKAAIGLLIGLGFAALVEGLRQERSLAALTWVGGLGAVSALTYGWAKPLLDLTRDEKIVALYWVGGIALALGLGILLMSQPRTRGEAVR